jgi:hypothetical protein
LSGWWWPARVSTHDRWAGSNETLPGGWVSSTRAARVCRRSAIRNELQAGRRIASNRSRGCHERGDPVPGLGPCAATPGPAPDGCGTCSDQHRRGAALTVKRPRPGTRLGRPGRRSGLVPLERRAGEDGGQGWRRPERSSTHNRRMGTGDGAIGCRHARGYDRLSGAINVALAGSNGAFGSRFPAVDPVCPIGIAPNGTTVPPAGPVVRSDPISAATDGTTTGQGRGEQTPNDRRPDRPRPDPTAHPPPSQVSRLRTSPAIRPEARAGPRRERAERASGPGAQAGRGASGPRARAAQGASGPEGASGAEAQAGPDSERAGRAATRSPARARGRGRRPGAAGRWTRRA